MPPHIEGAGEVGLRTDAPLSRQSTLAGFVQRPQAARTEVHTALLPFKLDPHTLDVGLESAVSRPFGVTNVVPELGALATHFTLCHHNHLAVVRSGVYLTTRCSFTQLANTEEEACQTF